MAETIGEVSEQLRELKASLLHYNWAVTAKYDTDHQEKDPDKQPKTEVFPVTELKMSLISFSPKVVTDDLLPFDFVKRFAEMYEELQKEPLSEFFEAGGLDGIGAAVEKWYEGHEAKWEYTLYAALGLIVPLAIGGAVIWLKRAVLEAVRDAQFAATGRAATLNPDTNRWERQTRDQITTREQAAGGGMASIPRDADFGPLRAQLEALNPRLAAFNRYAPDFISNFKKLPSESRAIKAGEGVKAVSGAITGINHQAMVSVARGMSKITGAVNNSNPKKTRDYAGAIGKLASAIGRLKIDDVRAATQALLRLKVVIRNLKPENIPKSGDMRSAAGAANSLDKAARRLTGSLTPLGPALRGVSTAAAATAGNLGA
ncbi:hypothetical protein [Streptomyces antarcticus]|nr:hypothetical protein [Streptomyces sp. H34-AA3]MCY0941560.1 hypothetical protein [Streptomyces sp. H34-AA3]